MTDTQHRKEEELTLAHQKQTDFLNDADRYDTIQFTQEDLEAMRQPNAQPLDSDYFISSPYSNSAKPKAAIEVETDVEEANSRSFFARDKKESKETASYEEFKEHEQVVASLEETSPASNWSWVTQLFRQRSSNEDTRRESDSQEAPPAGNIFNQLKAKFSSLGQKEAEQATTLNLDEAAEWTEAEVAEYSEALSQETTHFSEPILTDQVLEELLNEDDLTVESELNDQQNLVRGAAWLTFGNVFSRILGALYVIPWATWLGAEYVQANGLYSAGYVPYSLFLAVATAGFPSAVAKQMAYHHSRKEYKVADKLFKYSVAVMLLTGLVSSAILFLFAPTLASHTPTENLEAAIAVIRSLVPALLILPLMSVLRGYFQGFNDMVPTAVSQVIEQIARVVYMLAATYAITQLYFGEVTQAVVHSTFAAFIGALASLVYLVIIYLRRLPLWERLMAQSQEQKEIDFKESIRIMLVDSIPFILLGSGIIIAQVIDTYTFRPILYATTILRNREIVELYGVLSLDVNKLIMIIISLAVAVSTSAIPAISSKFAVRDIDGTRSVAQRVIVLFCYIMFPAAVGMASLSTNIYQLFYAQGSVHGPNLLITACYMSIVLGAYTVLSTVLQSMDYRRATIQYLAVGLVVKLILQLPLIALFQTHGVILSTAIGFAVSTGLMYWKINHRLHVATKEFSVQLIKITVATIIMGISTTLWGRMLDAAFGEVGRGLTFVKVSFVVLMGILIYFAVMALFGMLPILFGNRHKALQDKLKVM